MKLKIFYKFWVVKIFILERFITLNYILNLFVRYEFERTIRFRFHQFFFVRIDFMRRFLAVLLLRNLCFSFSTLKKNYILASWIVGTAYLPSKFSFMIQFYHIDVSQYTFKSMILFSRFNFQSYSLKVQN